MKEKVLCFGLLVAIIATFFAGCGGNSSPAIDRSAKSEASAELFVEVPMEETSTTTYELVLVTDSGTIYDKAFNQRAWEGLEKYATENNITHTYYQPQDKTTESYVETIGIAIENGAKLIVCTRYLFEESVFIAQEQYPDINFILLDGEPHNGDYSEYKTSDNTMPILFAEEQAGYLAGYAAVQDGITKLGFMGGMAINEVLRLGYGFVKGADDAAAELGIETEIMYHYTGEFIETPETQAMAASWYQNGTEVIFAYDGTVSNSVMKAAEETNQKVIGVDVDCADKSSTVMTSAMKMLDVAVYDGIKAYYAGNFPGGETTLFTAENNGIGLPMSTSQFENFTEEDYTRIYEALASGEITITNDIDDKITADFKLTNSKINVIK